MAQFSELIPELRPFARELVRAAGAAGLLPRVTSTRRSFAEQKRLYSRYLAGLSPYPAAPPGHSAHEYGFAFDMIVSPLEDLVDVGQYWESLGGVWGGRKGDDVHFEYPGFKAALGSTIDYAQGVDDVSKATGVGVLDIAGTASGFVGLPFALLSLIEIAASRKEAEHIIDEWNYLTGSHIKY